MARRTFLTRSLAGAGAAWAGRQPFAPSPAAAQPVPGNAEEPTPAERAAMAGNARTFMQTSPLSRLEARPATIASFRE
jgi:hypothetical protein